MADIDKDFLEYIVKVLVDNPDEVSVERKVDEMGVLITLRVSPEDMGKIIGRSGNTAKAIRTLLRVVGMKNNARVNLKIEEPEGSERARTDEQGEGERVRTDEQEGSERVTKTVDEAMDDLKI